MRQRIGRRQRGQGKRRSNRLFQPSGIAKGANQAVVSLNMPFVHRNRHAKSLSRLSRRPGGEQLNPALAKLIGSQGVGWVHGYL